MRLLSRARQQAVFALVILVLIGLPLIAQPPSEKEAALGKGLAAEVRRRTTALENLTIQNYLDRLGQRIAAQFPDPKLIFSFNAIAEDLCPSMHEPLGLPGGYVFVPAALFLAAGTEAEFAGMLAHAMAHIAKRHGIRNAVNSGSSPVIFLGGWAGGCSELVPRGFLAAQRSNELEADVLAIETVTKAGLDPEALRRYIERPSPPDREQRLARISSALESLPSVVSIASPDEFTFAQRIVRGLAKPPDRSARAPSLRNPRVP